MGVQGNGAVDIPTHLVDQAQWLLEGTGVAPGEVPVLLGARVANLLAGRV